MLISETQQSELGNVIIAHVIFAFHSPGRLHKHRPIGTGEAKTNRITLHTNRESLRQIYYLGLAACFRERVVQAREEKILTIHKQHIWNMRGYEQSHARFSQRRKSWLPKLKVDLWRLAFSSAYCERQWKSGHCNISHPISADKPRTRPFSLLTMKKTVRMM